MRIMTSALLLLALGTSSTALATAPEDTAAACASVHAAGDQSNRGYEYSIGIPGWIQLHLGRQHVTDEARAAGLMSVLTTCLGRAPEPDEIVEYKAALLASPRARHLAETLRHERATRAEADAQRTEEERALRTQLADAQARADAYETLLLDLWLDGELSADAQAHVFDILVRYGAVQLPPLPPRDAPNI